MQKTSLINGERVAAALAITDQSYNKIIDDLKYEIECLKCLNSSLAEQVLKNRRNKAGAKKVASLYEEFAQKMIVGKF